MDGWKRKWACKGRRVSTIFFQLRQMSEVSLWTNSLICWSRAAIKQHRHEESRNSLSGFHAWVCSLSKTRITDWVKSEEAASLHLRSSMTLTMISNGDKCGVKGLQAHEFLSHSIKDGIKRRPSLMCHSCKKRRWRTRDEKSFQGKCDGGRCFRCPDTDPHHDLEFWFSTCLMRIKDLG